jgi:hypothetical protein
MLPAAACTPHFVVPRGSSVLSGRAGADGRLLASAIWTLFRQDFGVRILSGSTPFYKRTYSPGHLPFTTTNTYRRAPLILPERFSRCFARTGNRRPRRTGVCARSLSEIDFV